MTGHTGYITFARKKLRWSLVFQGWKKEEKEVMLQAPKAIQLFF